MMAPLSMLNNVTSSNLLLRVPLFSASHVSSWAPVARAARQHWIHRRISLTPPAAASTDIQSNVPASRLSTPRDAGGDAMSYKIPPKPIEEIVMSPPEPSLSFSPDRTLVLQLTRPPPHPPVSELSRPELKLAGLRIDPESFSRSRMSYYTSLSYAPFNDGVVLPLKDGQTKEISGIPQGYWINYVNWAPSGKFIAFTLRSAGGDDDPPRGPLQLWVADVATGKARKLLDRGINAIMEDYGWVDDDTIIAAVLPENLPAAPSKPRVPHGPRIEDNSSGATSQGRTWPDLLQSKHDETLFDYYCTSELVSINVITDEIKTIAPPRIYTAVSPSPDGQYVLVSWMDRPFSYALPAGRFPKKVQLWDRNGKFIKEIANLPLAENIPIAFDSCRQGPRSIGWRDDRPHEIHWTECNDGGDPAVEIPEGSDRDTIYLLDASKPNDPPRRVAGTRMRCGGISWGSDDVALLYESEWKNRRSKTWIISPGSTNKAPELLYDRNYEDSYTDPGSPAMRRTKLGTYVLALVDGQRKLLLQGRGASANGSFPFLDVLNLDTKETERIWQCEAPYYEFTSSILSDLEDAPISLDHLQMLCSRESKDEPPQYYIKTFTNGGKTVTERQISNFPHPYPTLKGMDKEIVRYQREDGVDLTGTFYLPPGYNKDKDGQLPCILWAYPREFKSKDAAGQLRKSPYQFTGIGSTSPLLWLSMGYAVLDGPGFPIIAEGDEEPNDTYVEQLTSSARAAVKELERLGSVDITRIAVGGHSYGAFMAAGLLAHAHGLFACGIARSGAYNRTLTPMGFQSEERTLWQAKDAYWIMSPFMQADKIKTPLLLIHGEADNNPGTFPMQSERLYQALKGHGGVSRLVVLPFESHSYVGLESVMHCLAEMNDWMEVHMMNGRTTSD